ncbi:MAG: hypothetical protein IPO61_07460 [Gammaproteobacteria bacterium]|nr:hypothetical protein [Gammaproteobacteria bacterium]
MKEGDYRWVRRNVRDSGTTPTLMGDRNVTITDNADGRINLVVYHQRLRTTGLEQYAAGGIMRVDAG